MDYLRQAVHTVTACCLNCHEDTTSTWANGVSGLNVEKLAMTMNFDYRQNQQKERVC